ncbi:MAG TPA: phosphatidylinositol mannoside acyltransferase [Trebonia sp.]|nr:phosphatidylinositol mannoside acyltransferase [Trebonia sp.]
MIKDRLLDAAFGAGWTLVCKLPESWARDLFQRGADIAWGRQGEGVQVLEGNLLRVLRALEADGRPLPGLAKVDGKQLRALSRQVMRSYARYYLEAFRIQTYSPERIADGMHIEGPNIEISLEHLKNGRGVIYALPHMGNFEQAGAWIIGQGAGSFTTVAERLKPESLFERFLKFREELGFEVLPTTGGPNPSGVMAQRLRKGKLVCLVADRDLSNTAVEVDFLGEKALMPAGPAALAVQTGAALMPVSCWFVGDDEWGAHVYDEIPVPATGDRREKVTAMTQQMAGVFEEAILEHPEDWHMLQRIFVADLDPERLARSREGVQVNGGSGKAPTAL